MKRASVPCNIDGVLEAKAIVDLISHLALWLATTTPASSMLHQGLQRFTVAPQRCYDPLEREQAQYHIARANIPLSTTQQAHQLLRAVGALVELLMCVCHHCHHEDGASSRWGCTATTATPRTLNDLVVGASPADADQSLAYVFGI